MHSGGQQMDGVWLNHSTALLHAPGRKQRIQCVRSTQIASTLLHLLRRPPQSWNVHALQVDIQPCTSWLLACAVPHSTAPSRLSSGAAGEQGRLSSSSYDAKGAACWSAAQADRAEGPSY